MIGVALRHLCFFQPIRMRLRADVVTRGLLEANRTRMNPSSVSARYRLFRCLFKMS